ncbi:adenylyl-sulfate kinase [Hyphomicrobium sp.]|uniref:adenylyl-sulfate kinase n=1 Tax=Hyphomicrobium sp. TaxID=82 RepID=UPI002D77AD5F|nr:adenylyl-sulfate kinase [Hyphomicrobium sp.]HET6390280.1 adenylyl-sulfate kinase [Hyphomicrobium sp.]
MKPLPEIERASSRSKLAPRSRCELQWKDSPVTKRDRAGLKTQRPCCIWLTGLSGAGKTTLANVLDEALHSTGRHTFVLDGDRCRDGICSDLDFSPEGRMENVRRVSEVAKLMVDAGLIVIVSLISPLIVQRQRARKLFEPGEFLEVYLNTPLATCEQRDAKGLYKKARQGIIPDFTGISSAYEPPESPELVLNGEAAISDLLRQMLQVLKQPVDLEAVCLKAS